MEKEDIIVSAVMPTYNSEKTVIKSVESVLNQTFVKLELIIIDDGSKDRTLEIISNIKDSRVKVIALKQNMGANHARNIGILEAQGKYIAFADSDDSWLPEKLSVQLDYMQKNQLNASFTPYVVEQNGEVIPKDYQRYVKDYSNVKSTLRKYNIIRTPTFIVKKDIFKNTGMFDEELPRLQDYELAIRIIEKYNIGCCPKILLSADSEASIISKNKTSLFSAIGLIISKHYEFLNFNEENIFFNSLFTHEDIVEEEALSIIMEKCKNFKYEFMQKIVEEQNFRCQCNNKIRNMLNTANYSLIKSKDFVIWGAGIEGKKLYEKLKSQKKIPAYFIVSDEPKIQDIDNIKVVNVNEIQHENYIVIIAVSKKYQMEILSSITSYNFKSIFAI